MFEFIIAIIGMIMMIAMINHGFRIANRIAVASETTAMMTSALFKTLSPEAQDRAEAEIAKVLAPQAAEAQAARRKRRDRQAVIATTVVVAAILGFFLLFAFSAHAQSGYRPNYDTRPWEAAEPPKVELNEHGEENREGGWGVDACYFSKKPDPRPAPPGGWHNCVSIGYFPDKAGCELLRKELRKQEFKVGKCKIIKD